jgi:hypothetical protein
VIYGLIPFEILTRFIWLILSIYIEKLRKNVGVPYARTAAAGWAVGMAWSSGRDRMGVVLPLNPHNYGSYSLYAGRFHCRSFTCYCRLRSSASACLLRLLISSWSSSLPHREHIFRAPPSVILFRFRDNHIFSCTLVLPVLVPMRTGTGRVGLRNACRLRVCLLGWRVAITFLRGVAGGRTTRLILYFLEDRWCSAWLLVYTGSSGEDRWCSAWLLVYTGSSGTTTSTNNISSSASSSSTENISRTNLLRSWLTILSLNIIYMLVTLKTHKHIHDVTNMLILLTVFFWIKLLLV